MNNHYEHMGPSAADAERRADKSYPDLQHMMSEFNRPSLGDFVSFGLIVSAASLAVVGAVWFLFASLT